jgi:hypothetical protein
MKHTYTLLIIASVLLISACGYENEEAPELQYDMTELIFEHPECQTIEGPCVTLQFIYPEFRGDDRLTERLRAWSQQKLFDLSRDTEEADPERLAREWFNDYDYYAAEIEDYNISWTLERRVDIVYTTPALVSIHFNEFSFTGGAHPSQVDIFRSFNRSGGEEITLSDLTQDEYQMGLLSDLVEEQFRSTYELLEDDELEDTGYWYMDSDFYLTENFAFTDFGILFYFNVYEVAPHATGPIAVEIRYSDLESILHSQWLHKHEQLSLQ